MSSHGVSQWFGRLAQGDDAAFQAIWEHFFDRLVRLADKRLDGLPRRIADEEDVALSAMRSFYRGVTAGRFPHLYDRGDL